MAKAALRQRQTRRRYCPNARIADQWQDRVIERCRRNFDRSFLCRLRMRGKNLADQFLLARDHKLLIVERIVVPLSDQRGDIFFFEKEFVKPCNLRQDLQIGKILWLKIPRSEERRVGKECRS